MITIMDTLISSALKHAKLFRLSNLNFQIVLKNPDESIIQLLYFSIETAPIQTIIKISLVTNHIL